MSDVIGRKRRPYISMTSGLMIPKGLRYWRESWEDEASDD